MGIKARKGKKNLEICLEIKNRIRTYKAETEHVIDGHYETVTYRSICLLSLIKEVSSLSWF